MILPEQPGLWEKEFHGFESLTTATLDDAVLEAIEWLAPVPEWDGTIKITVEYYPNNKEADK